MNVATHTIKIQHETFGTILEEKFVDPIQFKLFLKMIHGCIELKNNLSFFNGIDFYVHVPFKHLVDSIIVTKVDAYSLTEHMLTKSKMEAEQTR